MKAQRIAIFGHGPVGRETARLLLARGDFVRIVQRKPPADLLPGALFIVGDLLSAVDVEAACDGVDTVICTAGLPYRASVWERDWPVAMDNLVNGCAASGARLVFADNLYMYGPQTVPLREELPLTDFGIKPRVRAEITREWRDAHRAGRVKAVAVRASDFYGPDVPNSVISYFGVRAMLAGKVVMLPYGCDQPHDFTYVPDFAHALVTLADAPDADYGQAWHVPNAPTRTLRQVLQLASELAGVKLRIRVLPGWLRGIMGRFVPELVEMDELAFQTDRPYIVDSRKFLARFGIEATPFETGLAETIASYRKG
ncbi:MAG: NAD-dependent epimerase/dehydratase family protein [Rhodobiaceae bacterium]|nr:NAD-dependent epimerase/dehydratase family protein [Rhodobiaceae bacterium]MCC0053527.1 NAD-dependent epimerase/dehydratase family protein [Rhodobiaceae bacterium]